MDKVKAIKLLKYWKSQLRITDYNIKLNIDEPDMDSQGLVQYMNESKCAVIYITSKDDFGKRMLKYDFEKILVHELLHVKYGICEKHMSDVLYDVHHQNLEDIARALVFSKRNKHVKDYEDF